jgi:hypothetical protein
MAGVRTSINVGALLRQRGSAMPSLSLSALSSVDDVMEGVLADWNAELVAYWPVDTGFSLSRWLSLWQWPTWALMNDADYAEWVRRSGGFIGEAHQHMFDRALALLRRALPRLHRIVREDTPPQRPVPLPPVNLAAGFARADDSRRARRRERRRSRER